MDLKLNIRLQLLYLILHHTMPYSVITRLDPFIQCILHASCLDLLLSVTSGTLLTKWYDKRDDFDFRIVYFPFCSSIHKLLIQRNVRGLSR